MVELLLSSETLEVRIVVISWGTMLRMGCERTSEGVGSLVCSFSGFLGQVMQICSLAEKMSSCLLIICTYF